MNVKPSRIYTTFEQNGLPGGEVRDLYRITRNEHGDFLFHLDGGEVWQYTELKREKRISEPTVENIMQIGSGVKDGKPLPFMCFLVLKNKEFSTGNLRKFPPKADAAAQSVGNPVEEVVKRIESLIDEGVGQIAKAAQDATLPPGKRKWWENLLAAFKTCPASMKEGEKWEAVARKVLTGVWENTGNASWTSVYLGKTTFRNLSEEYRKKKTAFPLWKDKLWTLLDRQWTAAQEKAWGEKLRRYAERERDKVQEKTAEPKKPA